MFTHEGEEEEVLRMFADVGKEPEGSLQMTERMSDAEESQRRGRLRRETRLTSLQERNEEETRRMTSRRGSMSEGGEWVGGGLSNNCGLVNKVGVKVVLWEREVGGPWHLPHCA